MNAVELGALLSELTPGTIRYLPSVGSTNDAAREWLASGAPDFALIAADEQTAGRGQGNHTWQSPAGTCIAVSLVLREHLDEDHEILSRVTALGALAVCDALSYMSLSARIKWPNDVLLSGRKVAGVLAEGVWSGNTLDGVVLGIGVNVRTTSVQQALAREGALRFPAVSIEEIAGYPPDRWEILNNIVRSLRRWRAHLYEPIFLKTWEETLAFLGEPIRISNPEGKESEPAVYEGILAGLSNDGALRLRTTEGTEMTFYAGEVRLQPGTLQRTAGQADFNGSGGKPDV